MFHHQRFLVLELTIDAGALIQTSQIQSFEIGAGALIRTSCIERSEICVHCNWVPLATMDVGFTGIQDAFMRFLAILYSATLAGIKVSIFWWQGAIIGFISQRVVVAI